MNVETANAPALIPPGWERARLPALYERAKQILLECESVDECKRWTARAEALASYYRQTQDDVLVSIAERIKLRAWRRIGELLKEADATIDLDAVLPNGGHAKLGGTILGEISGIDRRNMTAARRLAGMDAREFEREIERPTPPRLMSHTKTSRPREVVGAERFAHHVRALACIVRRYPGASFRAEREDLEIVQAAIAALTRGAS